MKLPINISSEAKQHDFEYITCKNCGKTFIINKEDGQ